MLIVIVWWLWLQVMGLAALPLAYRFFRRLPDRGYAFARPLGLLLATYLLWVGGSLGLLRNSVGGALLSIGLVAGISLVVYRRGRSDADPGLLAWLRANGRLVLSIELLFAGALALWSLMRAYSPEITTAGGEKFMEIMYLNSIGRSEFFPPHDAWLSGYAISYYYFGYVMMATLTRLSGFAAHLTFNVGLASLFALTCTGGFGLVYNLVHLSENARRVEKPGRRVRPIRWGFLGAALIAVLGNLEGFLEVLYSSRALPESFWRWLDIVDINQPFDPNVGPSLLPTRSGWWWWRASRVIHDLDPLGNSVPVQPIDEFPGFSFLLGDMHPHVLALPFVLLALALALWALLQGTGGDDLAGETRGWKGLLARIPLLVPLSLGALAFLNTWDFPIYWAIFVAAYGLGRWVWHRSLNRDFLQDVGMSAAATAVVGLLLYLPFYIGFQSQAGGLLPTLYVGTRFRQYFVMFGPFLVAILGFVIVLAVQATPRTGRKELIRDWMAWTAALLIVPLVVMLLIAAFLLLTPSGREMLEGIRRVPAVYQVVGDAPWPQVLTQLLLVKLRTWLMPLVVAAATGMGVTLLQRSFRSGPAELEGGVGGHHVASEGDSRRIWGEGYDVLTAVLQFVLLCAIAGLLLTLSVEFFYLVDNFGVRMNTIFKFYFQAWVLMAIASAFGVYWLGRRAAADEKQPRYAGLRTVFQVGFWLLFAAGMVYPVLGNISRAGNFDHEPTLDGTAYLAESQADDYAATTWLNEQIAGAPIILEAPGSGGSSYVYEGRVSALTGLPTLLGWAGHESQWRGSYAVQSAREPDIETIYGDTSDVERTRTLLEEYGVSYVYVGPLERSRYDPRAWQKFARFMDIAYENEGVTIYRMRK
jgi:YYY domain-containing protein